MSGVVVAQGLVASATTAALSLADRPAAECVEAAGKCWSRKAKDVGFCTFKLQGDDTIVLDAVRACGVGAFLALTCPLARPDGCGCQGRAHPRRAEGRVGGVCGHAAGAGAALVCVQLRVPVAHGPGVAVQGRVPAVLPGLVVWRALQGGRSQLSLACAARSSRRPWPPSTQRSCAWLCAKEVAGLLLPSACVLTCSRAH